MQNTPCLELCILLDFLSMWPLMKVIYFLFGHFYCQFQILLRILEHVVVGIQTIVKLYSAINTRLGERETVIWKKHCRKRRQHFPKCRHGSRRHFKTKQNEIKKIEIALDMQCPFWLEKFNKHSWHLHAFLKERARRNPLSFLHKNNKGCASQ